MTAQAQHEPVAIVGMGCRWPGAVRNAPDLWEFLKNRVDGWREFDDPRFSTKGFYHPNTDRPGTMAMKGAFLTEDDARTFDHSFFGITPLEVETMDPSQRKLLEVTYEALENAGETWDSISGTRTGVFVGNFCLDHWMIQSRDWDYPRPYAFTGAGTSILANRISYIFNLHGPSLTVDTACSSSMYALHLAINAIRAGDCDSAVVASANLIADPNVQIALDKLGALSASSRCHTFDAMGDGYARGEGYAAIYLKRPSLAISDGSPIRAMIRGTSMNANGRTGGITRPSAAGQEAVIREAYRNAGDLPFSDTDYFECHGTGTYVGDPIEVTAVGNVFAKERDPSNPLLVGSVKSNLGHTEGASALASVMKVVLALELGAIPPIYKLENLNPNIPFEKANVKPVTELTPWPRDNLRRASINSFGYGGANAHCIIDHVSLVLPDYVAPGVYHNGSNGFARNGYLNGHSNRYLGGKAVSQHSPIVKALGLIRSPDAATRQLVLLPLSAHNETSLKLNVKALSEAIDKFSLANVAYTYSVKRSKLAYRSFHIVDKAERPKGLKVVRKPLRSPLEPSRLGFIFTGQGAQWNAMGAELFEYKVFRDAVIYQDHVLASLPSPPSWTLYNALSGNCEPEFIQKPAVSQAVCTAVQVGLIDLLASWSIQPSAVVGHSSGEMAAAYASGRITAAEAIIAAYIRGQAVSKNKKTGQMLAVGISSEQVSKYLAGKEEQIKVAAINSPGSVTLSGEVNAINEIATALSEAGVFNRALRTGGNAYHSHHMADLGEGFENMLNSALDQISNAGLIDKNQRYPIVPWCSSVTPDKPMSKDGATPLYWRSNLESPVRFSEAVTNLTNLETPVQVLVEIGPHPALKSPLDQITKAAGKPIQYASTLKRNEDARESVLTLAGSLFSFNANIDLVAVNAIDGDHGLEHGVTSVDLPPYQYTYGNVLYHESRGSKEHRYRKVPRHDLLGSKVVGTAKLRPQWRNILRMKDLPWLGDHRLLPDAVLPGAAYMVIAIEAAQRIHNEFPEIKPIAGFSLRNVSIKTSLEIPEDDYGVELISSLELVDTATASSPAWASFSISSVGRESNEWSEHCTGLVKIEVGFNGVGEKLNWTSNASRNVDSRTWYKRFTAIGLGYGETFQPLSEICADPDNNLASARLALNTTADSIKGGESSYPMHPASLDGAIQLGLIASHGGRAEEASTAFVPVQLSQLYLKNGVTDTFNTVIARGERRGIRGAHLDFQIVDANGEVVLNAENLRCISYSSESKSLDKAFDVPFARLAWMPHISSMSNRQLQAKFPPPKENVDKSSLWAVTNKLAFMVVYSIYEKFGKMEDGPNPSGDVGHFFAWIKRCGIKGNSVAMEEARQLTHEARLQKIDELISQAPEVMEVKIAKLLHDNMGDILYERRTGVDVILAEDLLTPLYKTGLLMTGIYPQLYNILDSIAHENPNQRIFEIGGGTGGATRIAMKAWNGPGNIKRYRDYTFTDISAGFLSGTRETLSEFHDMIYSVFDAEIEPEKQGYELGAYDLVIACQVLHATSNMQKTLNIVRKLLKPGGRLVLVETTQNFMVPGVVVGTFTGYWAGIPDGRVDAPFMSLSSWDKALRKAGFSGTDLVLDDFPRPQNTTSVIVSTVLPQEDKKNSLASVQVLHSAEIVPVIVSQIIEEFKSRCIHANIAPMSEALAHVTPNSQVIAVLDEDHLLVNANKDDLTIFQHLARNVGSLTILTSCGILKGRNPDGAVMSGLLRVLGTEYPAGKFLSIDIDAKNFQVNGEEVIDLVRSIVEQQLMLDKSDVYDDKDCEFVWQDGCLWVSRLAPDASDYGVESQGFKTETLPIDSQQAVRAAFETPGVLGSLYFTPYKELLQPLPHDFIEVGVAAVGLGSRDLDLWAGRSNANYLSTEYAGVVTAVGSDVGEFEIGDRVFGVGKGQFGTHTRIPAAFAQKLEPEYDIVQMASMPLAYITAIYAIDHVAGLRKGQTILIQSATSDLGLATLQLAQAKGATVFAMFDTHDQARFLVEELRLPTAQVLSSRDHSSLKRRKAGFNVIMSTAQGDLFYESLKALAPLGHLIDIGRMDIQNAKDIGLELFQKNSHFCSIDPVVLLDSDPELVAELMKTVERYLHQGLIGPICRVVATDVSQLSDNLSSLMKGDLIGKFVVTFADPNTVVRMTPPSPIASFDPEACYIITGGLGGLGRSIVRWMGDRGARHITLLSRRSIDTVNEAQSLIQSLAAKGINVIPVVCDIGDALQVDHAIQMASASRVLKGIVHAAVSYEDISFDKVDLARWQAGLAAKVSGTKHLHQATLSHPLDFFVMTTTLVSLYALATQGAYVAANNFQDYFARYRRQSGLPASTASFSLINDITNVGSNAGTIATFERNKALTLSENQFLALLEPAFLPALQTVQNGQWCGAGYDPLSASNFLTCLNPSAMVAKLRDEQQISAPAPRWYSDARASLVMRAFVDAQNHTNGASAGNGMDDDASTTAPSRVNREFKAAIAQGADAKDSTVAYVEKSVTAIVAEILFVDEESIDPAKSVADHGVDSLIAAELRNWFVQALGTNISMLNLLDQSSSINAVCRKIVDDKLQEVVAN